jgi:hypothetical protein
LNRGGGGSSEASVTFYQIKEITSTFYQIHDIAPNKTAVFRVTVAITLNLPYITMFSFKYGCWK